MVKSHSHRRGCPRCQFARRCYWASGVAVPGSRPPIPQSVLHRLFVSARADPNALTPRGTGRARTSCRRHGCTAYRPSASHGGLRPGPGASEPGQSHRLVRPATHRWGCVRRRRTNLSMAAMLSSRRRLVRFLHGANIAQDCELRASQSGPQQRTPRKLSEARPPGSLRPLAPRGNRAICLRCWQIGT